MNDTPGKAWVGLGWRQWLYAFADLENRIDCGAEDVGRLLRSAEKVWTALDRANVLLEDPENNGEWVGSWQRALDEHHTMR
jgi:hypothetical protein